MEVEGLDINEFEISLIDFEIFRDVFGVGIDAGYSGGWGEASKEDLVPGGGGVGWGGGHGVEGEVGLVELLSPWFEHGAAGVVPQFEEVEGFPVSFLHEEVFFFYVDKFIKLLERRP